jgi:hypothetical protein
MLTTRPPKPLRRGLLEDAKCVAGLKVSAKSVSIIGDRPEFKAGAFQIQICAIITEVSPSGYLTLPKFISRDITTI